MNLVTHFFDATAGKLNQQNQLGHTLKESAAMPSLATSQIRDASKMPGKT